MIHSTVLGRYRSRLIVNPVCLDPWIGTTAARTGLESPDHCGTDSVTRRTHNRYNHYREAHGARCQLAPGPDPAYILSVMHWQRMFSSDVGLLNLVRVTHPRVTHPRVVAMECNRQSRRQRLVLGFGHGWRWTGAAGWLAHVQHCSGMRLRSGTAGARQGSSARGAAQQ